MKKVLLSNLIEESNLSAIGILVSSDGTDDQDSCEKGLMKIISLIRKEHPMVEISVLPYFAKDNDYISLNEKVQNFSKNFKLTLTIINEDEIRIFDFLPATQLNSVQIKLS